MSYELDKDGRTLSVKVFVNAPYDQYVNPDTRFWHASGVDVSLNASGLNVQTQSVLSLLIGSVTPPSGATLRPADANTVFTLFRDRTLAFSRPLATPRRSCWFSSNRSAGLHRAPLASIRPVYRSARSWKSKPRSMRRPRSSPCR